MVSFLSNWKFRFLSGTEESVFRIELGLGTVLGNFSLFINLAVSKHNFIHFLL